MSTTTFTFAWERVELDPSDEIEEFEVLTDDRFGEPLGVWGVARSDGSWEAGWDRAHAVVEGKDDTFATGTAGDLEAAKAAVEEAIVTVAS